MGQLRVRETEVVWTCAEEGRSWSCQTGGIEEDTVIHVLFGLCVLGTDTALRFRETL